MQPLLTAGSPSAHSSAAGCWRCHRALPSLTAFPSLPFLSLPVQPLYTELSLIVHQAQADRPSANPSRVSASLERFSTGAGAERGSSWSGCA